MREFSIVRPEFWMGRTGRELRSHPADVRELAFYLFSCPNNEQYGLYYKPIATMAQEMGRTEKTVQESLAVLAGLTYCTYDDVNDWVWVVEMAQIQMGLPLLPRDYKVNAANKWYQKMPKNQHLGPFFDRYCDSLLLAPPRRNLSPTKSVSCCEHSETEGAVDSLFGAVEPLISISISSTEVLPEKREVHTERFDRFWEAYPWKVGKKAARAEWDKIKPDDELTAKIVAAIGRHKTSQRWLREGGQSIPDPERYIKNERWNDEYDGRPNLAKQTIKNVQQPGSFLDGFR
jgi:hypothetical protein